MLYPDDDIYPVTRLTAGVIGDAGRPILVLQAHYGADAVSWVIHKEHAVALSRTIPRLLADVRAEFPELDEPLVAAQPNLALKEPPYPRFRVGSMGLGYDRIHDLVVLTLVDANVEQAMAAGALPEEAALNQTHIFATRGQALLLGQHVETVVVAGRPLCPSCGDPLDDFGHFCLPPLLQRKVEGFFVQ